MKKNIFLTILSLIICITFLELVLRINGFRPAHESEYENIMKIEPNDFLVASELKGWELNNGCFTTLINSDTLFNCCIDKNGNRVIEKNLNNEFSGKHKEKLNLYGCSFTFGYSVDDSSHLGVSLQKHLPDYEITNRGVPGYGLAQIYLSILEDIENNKKPKFAVVNYSTFQNERTPLNKRWARSMYFAFKQSSNNEVLAFKYPYFIFSKSNQIILKYDDFEDLSKDFFLRDKLSTINVLNSLFDEYYDTINREYIDNISVSILEEIEKLCSENNIELVIAYYFKEDLDVLKSSNLKAQTVFYDVDISNENFNCAPLDPSHPNKKANELFTLILKKELIKN